MKNEKGKEEQRLYYDLAWTWPLISPPEDYVEEAEIIANAIKQFARIDVKTLLNLGCGGGHEDFTLKNHFQVTGMDISDNMLALARQLNPECEYVKGDWRTARLDKEFDSVIATSLIYMKSQDELSSAFITVNEHLKNGGVFITFAEKTKENFTQNDTSCSTHKKGDINIAFLENYYDPNPDDTIFEGTFIYLIRKKNVLEVHKDHHICGLFSLGTWLDLLKDVGFEVEIKNVKLSVATGKEYFPMLICKKH